MPWWEIVLSVAVPLLTIFIGWWLRALFERRNLERLRLYDDRRPLYMKVLSPYVRALRGVINPDEQLKAMEELQSYAHLAALTELTLLASDDVVLALNSVIEQGRSAEVTDNPDNQLDLIRLWGALYLAIRRDLGNRNTALGELDMFYHLITDIQDLEALQKSRQTTSSLVRIKMLLKVRRYLEQTLNVLRSSLPIHLPFRHGRDGSPRR